MTSLADDRFGAEIAQQPGITAQATRVRRGNNVRLVLGANTPNNQDDRLISLMVEARGANDFLLAAEGDALDIVAASAGHSRKHFSRLVRLRSA